MSIIFLFLFCELWVIWVLELMSQFLRMSLDLLTAMQYLLDYCLQMEIEWNAEMYMQCTALCESLINSVCSFNNIVNFFVHCCTRSVWNTRFGVSSLAKPKTKYFSSLFQPSRKSYTSHLEVSTSSLQQPWQTSPTCAMSWQTCRPELISWAMR